MDIWEMDAFLFAKEKHKGQRDDEDLPYFIAHILHAVSIVKQVTMDHEIIIATYLHDTLEDTETTYPELCLNFGVPVANLVLEVTHEGKKDSYGYYFPRLKSQKAIMIKFADRLSNISRMEAWPPKRREAYLKKSQFWKDGSDR